MSDEPNHSSSLMPTPADVADPVQEDPVVVPEPDPAEALRAEIRRDYSVRLAHAELRVEATRAGIDLPDGFVELLDLSKLLGEDGEPSADAIGLALQPFQELKKPKFIQNLGLGRQGPSYAPAAHVSLDARERH